MGNMTVATVVVVLLNVIMWFCAITMTNINPSGSVCYNVEGSIIGNVVSKDSQGAYNGSVVDNSALQDLPGSISTVTVSQTGLGTDLFTSILSFLKTVPGLNYLINVVSAPYNILKCTGLPNEFVVGLGSLWYIVTFLILISYLWWRD